MVLESIIPLQPLLTAMNADAVHWVAKCAGSGRPGMRYSPWARQDTGTIWGGKLSLSFLNRPISVVHFDI